MPNLFRIYLLALACLLTNAGLAAPATSSAHAAASVETDRTQTSGTTVQPESFQTEQHAAKPQRIAVLDWTIAETMAAMGIYPAALAEKSSYEVWSKSPAMPMSTLDLGMRAQPNPDRLIRLQPELILASQDYAFVKTLLDKIGPTELLNVYTPGQDIYQNLTELAIRIGELTGHADKAASYIAQVSQALNDISQQLTQHRGQPVAIIQFIDARNVRIYGKPSLFSTALEKIGIRNAWTASVNQWGFQSVDLTHLASLPADSTIFVIKPFPGDLPKKLHDNVIWQTLPAVRNNRIILAEPIWTLGGLHTVLRFAQTVRDGMLEQDRNAGANAAFRFPGYTE